MCCVGSGELKVLRILFYLIVIKKVENSLLIRSRTEISEAREMISNIIVGIMCVIVIAAGVFGWWWENGGAYQDSKKEEDKSELFIVK